MDKRDEILDAASRIFQKYGLLKTNLDDVAGECGIKKTALYYYFKNKEDLFKCMFINDIESIKNKIVSEVEKQRTPLEKIRTYLNLRLSSLEKMQMYFDFFQSENAPLTYRGFAFSEKEKILHYEIEFVKNIISEGVSQGTFQVKDIRSLAFMLIGATFGLTYEIFCFGNTINLKQEIDNILEIILKGIEK
ncbi:MAG: TetR/AcrR family transcriptional regulator [Candidatus Cloacimonetes bacterium]|nr:TetR/AcrR family transcriptional regulator [Candidatus Cloacimonadota bacterium]